MATALLVALPLVLEIFFTQLTENPDGDCLAGRLAPRVVSDAAVRSSVLPSDALDRQRLVAHDDSSADVLVQRIPLVDTPFLKDIETNYKWNYIRHGVQGCNLLNLPLLFQSEYILRQHCDHT